MNAPNTPTPNTPTPTPNNFTCHSLNTQAIRGCCTGPGSLYTVMTLNATTSLAYCVVPRSERQAGSDFVNCITKAFGLTDRTWLVPGNEAVSVACVGFIPAVMGVNGAPTTTSIKWAAVALVAVLASTVVAL